MRPKHDKVLQKYEQYKIGVKFNHNCILLDCNIKLQNHTFRALVYIASKTYIPATFVKACYLTKYFSFNFSLFTGRASCCLEQLLLTTKNVTFAQDENTTVDSLIVYFA